MVAAPMTLLIPGAGPPATKIASLLIWTQPTKIRGANVRPSFAAACRSRCSRIKGSRRRFMNRDPRLEPRKDGQRVALHVGCMNFGKRTPAPEAERIIARALERGLSAFDTANAYNDGESERVLD